MNTKIPIGQRENQQLEFKSKDALRHLATVGRAVVAMLNSEGGDVWIGLREADGVAVTFEPIDNLDQEIGRLQDHFSDSIEPAPGPREIDFEKVEKPGVGAALRLRIKPVSDSGPRALREGAARLFIRRVGDRVRPMSHEEIASRFTAQHIRLDDVASEANHKMLKARDNWLSKGRALWLRIQPLNDLEIPFRSEDDFRKYFADPLVTANRAAGWNFVNPYERIRREGSALFHGTEGLGVRLYRDGAIEFTLPIDNLFWKSASGRSDAEANEIWPFCLLEYPISIFRLASTIYRDHALQRLCPVLADMALFGLKGWTLRPYSPRSFGYKGLYNPVPFDKDNPDEENLLLPKPLTFQRDELLNEPDRCGFRLVEQVYERFGYWEKEIPQEFDRDRGKLVFPNE
jgi:schlafen family protein